MGRGDWSCTVTGDVVSVERENNDKSGRNPKYTYVFNVRAVAVEGVPPGARLPAEVTFRADQRDLDRLGAAPPAVGEHLILDGRGNGPNPDSLIVTKLERA